MSDVWIENKEGVDEVLTDAVSVVLSDAEGTYGIRELESEEVVVEAGTECTKVATGRYAYDTSDLDPTVAYVASFKVTRTTGIIDYQTVNIPIGSSAPAATMCTVYGTVVDLAGNPIANTDVEVSVSREHLPRFAQHLVMSGTEYNTTTDENGYFAVSLVRGSLATIHIKESDLLCEFTVPDLVQVNIENIPGTYGSYKEVENPF